MERHEQDVGAETTSVGANPGYAAFQLAKALTASQEHDDPATRKRARVKVKQWAAVLQNAVSGSADYGSRTPIRGVPAWATLEVVTGGLATGGLLAAGPLEAHELDLLKSIPKAEDGEERRVLNGYFLTDDGLADLRNRLQTGCYDIRVPEEGVLLVVAWLVDNGHADEARSLLAEISPWLAKLRFYPISLDHPRPFDAQVHLQNVGETISNLERIKPNRLVLAQKEAIEVWAPFYDRLVALFLELDDSGSCVSYPEGWSRPAIALLEEYANLRKSHRLCGKAEKARGHFAQLRRFLAMAVDQPQSLGDRDIGRIRLILRRYVEKRGHPGSEACTNARRQQREHVAGPLHHDIGKVVIARLEKQPKDEGLDDVSQIQGPVDAEESRTFRLSIGCSVPESIRRKVERCLNETVTVLVERGLITSGEALAGILPQMTSGLRAVGISDPTLRQLYAAIYRAFRRRRSLLLLNLEKQVQFEELPWVAAIDRFRAANLSSEELAAQTLKDLASLALTSFPHAILPNKLLQEFRALSKDAGLDVPLVDEVAADIFMGTFSPKFAKSAKSAADLIEGSLYATYYGIDCDEIRLLLKPEKPVAKRYSRTIKPDAFAMLCASRAGVKLGTWDPATNGMILEQQQILTTQNLAALLVGFDLLDTLRGHLRDMAWRCFGWICERQRMEIDHVHARLIMLKNTAYAWRQMVFFLSLLSKQDINDFLREAAEHLRKKRDDFADRFQPALQGVILASEGQVLDEATAQNPSARRFLGWSKESHWLLANE